MKWLVALILALLLCSKCNAQKVVDSDPKGEYPRIEYWINIGEDALELFGIIPHPTRGFPLDSVYVCPTQDNLERVKAYIRKQGSGLSYLANAWDCDDFAHEASYLARRWGRTYYKGVPGAIAFGTAYIRVTGPYPLVKQKTGLDSSPRDVSYHALNVYKRNDGVWFFYEPQTGREEPVLSVVYEDCFEVEALKF